jgi:hypothetical protein
MKSQNEYQEVYYQASKDRWLHRCRLCWPLLMMYRCELAKRFDNGFIPIDLEYIHHDNCPMKGKF